jgi:dihydroneopterin aldolase
MDTASRPASIRLAEARIFVRGLVVQAEVGVYEHEHGRRQPLVLDVELEVAVPAADEGFEQIGDTVNYETIAVWARAVADSGHIKLVETFAEHVALACLREPRVLSARVRLDKPQALAPAVAGVEILLRRD